MNPRVRDAANAVHACRLACLAAGLGLGCVATLSGCGAEQHTCADGFERAPDGACLPGSSADAHIADVRGTGEAGSGDAGASDARVPGDSGPPLDASEAGACGRGCPAARPHCDEPLGRCVACLRDAHCTSETPRCDLSTGTCVECKQARDCTRRDASRCTEDHTCVACEADSDCAHLEAHPLCDEDAGQCVACIDDADCTSEAAPRCGPSGKTCVACRKSPHCDDPTASLCTGDHECAPCHADEHCAHLDATPVCDESEGRCVACTPGTEAQTCGPKSCNPATLTCSAYDRGTRRTCERCVSDRDCVDTTPDDPEPSHRCVPMEYEGTGREGAWCLKRAGLGCERPFVTSTGLRASLSGAEKENYCGINETLATCEAVRGLLGDATCPTGDDSECVGPGALCRTVDLAANRCTYRCSTAAECPLSGPASSCGPGTTTGPDFCGG